MTAPVLGAGMLTIALHLVTSGSLAAIPEGANKHEHAVLCDVLAIIDGDLEIPAQQSVDDDSYSIIRNLNFLTASNEWRKTFYSDEALTKPHTQPQASHTKIPGYASYWEDWHAAATALAQSKKPDEVVKAKLQELSSEAKKLAHERLRQLAEAAKQAKSRAMQSAGDPQEITKDSEINALKKVFFGTESATKTTVTTTNAFGQDPGNNRQNACEAESTNGKAKTLVAQLMCVCTKAIQGSGLTKACTADADGGTGWNHDSAAPNAADANAATKTCRAGKGFKITAQALRQAIKEAERLVHQDSAGNGYIGVYQTTGCTGGDTAGMCVKIASYGDDPTTGIKKLQWTSTLENLASKLEARSKYNAIISQLNEQLRHNSEQAELVIQLTKLEEAARSTASKEQTQKSATAAQVQDNLFPECEKITKAAQCREKKPVCQWKGQNDDDGEHCKLNATHVAQKAKEAGPGGNEETKTTDKCGAAKTPEECAAVKGEIPKDKRAVCGWIEGKCQDSSLLVNKKFSLIFASFMSLVSFKHFNDSYSILRNL